MAWFHKLFGKPSDRTEGSGAAGERKQERASRRELLYGVIRECMTQAGLLSSRYQFKVLSLDARGLQYLVMVDLPPDLLLQAAQQTALEGHIARQAHEGHAIQVSAVYWRVSDGLALPASAGSSPPVPQAAAPAVSPEPPGVAVPAAQVVAGAARTALEARFGEVHAPGNPAFQDTEIFPPQG